jgi:hypothetical protein
LIFVSSVSSVVKNLNLILIVLFPLIAGADRLTVEGGLPAGTSSVLKPLAYSETLGVFLVERNDQRPSGSERSWSFYGKHLDLLGYVTLSTDAGVSDEHFQASGDVGPRERQLAEMATQAREKLKTEPKSIDKVWADWQKLKTTVCPVKAVRREGSTDLLARDLIAAGIDTPLAPADAKRGCTAAKPGNLRCFTATDGNVVVVVPFKQDCGVSQELLVLYNPRNVEYLKEAQAGEAALKKSDVANARKHLERSLELEPMHAPAHFLHACVEARTGKPFRDGRAELEQILGTEEARQTWLPRIKSDPALANWRLDPEFNRWLLQFPTRSPTK